jgi:hypothetical protein
VPDARFAAPECDGDAQVKRGVGHGVEEPDAGGITVPAASEDAVEDI